MFVTELKESVSVMGIKSSRNCFSPLISLWVASLDTGSFWDMRIPCVKQHWFSHTQWPFSSLVSLFSLLSDYLKVLTETVLPGNYLKCSSATGE